MSYENKTTETYIERTTTIETIKNSIGEFNDGELYVKKFETTKTIGIKGILSEIIEIHLMMDVDDEVIDYKVGLTLLTDIFGSDEVNSSEIIKDIIIKSDNEVIIKTQLSN